MRGKTAHQLAAWGGWKTLAEVAHYTAEADRRRLTHDGANEERIADTASEPVSENAKNPIKIKGAQQMWRPRQD